MSGPKVVRVQTREEVEAICQRLLVEADAALRHYRAICRQHDLVRPEQEERFDRQRANLKELFQSLDFAACRSQAAAFATQLTVETSRIMEAAVTEAEAMRRRRRQIADAARSVAHALAASGRPVPPDLAALPARSIGASLEAMAGFEAIVERCLRDLSSGSAAAAMTSDLANRLAGDAVPATLAGWIAARPQPSSPARARLDATLAAIEVLAPAEMTAAFTARATLIETEPSERQALLTDSLILDATAAARRLREEADSRGQMAQVIAALDLLDTPEAQALARRASEVVGNPGAVAAFAAEADALHAAALSGTAAIARRKAILGGLAALGYEVRQEMETAWARNGRIIVSRPGATDYGVELSAPADASRVQARLIGSDRPASPRSAERDRDQEVLWCGDFDRLQHLIVRSGGELAVERAIAAGIQPVKTASLPDTDPVEIRNPATKTSRP